MRDDGERDRLTAMTFIGGERRKPNGKIIDKFSLYLLDTHFVVVAVDLEFLHL